MPPKKKPAAFTEPVLDEDSVDGSVEESSDEVVVEEPVTVMAKDADIINARVKGTWKMVWGQTSFNFEDGKRYKLPKDLYHYLRKSGNIYDTL